jgi:hypothetical protein
MIRDLIFYKKNIKLNIVGIRIRIRRMKYIKKFSFLRKEVLFYLYRTLVVFRILKCRRI